jgi:hypothetical protein
MTRVMVLASVTLLCGATGCGRAQAAGPSQAPALSVRAQARLEAAKKWAALEEARYRTGIGSGEEYFDALRAVYLSARESGGAKDELVKAAQEYRDAVARAKDSVKAGFNAGTRSSSDMAMSEYRLVEAEFWLAEIQSR